MQSLIRKLSEELAGKVKFGSVNVGRAGGACVKALCDEHSDACCGCSMAFLSSAD